MVKVEPAPAPAALDDESKVPPYKKCTRTVDQTLPAGDDGVVIKYLDSAPGSSVDGNNTVVLLHGMASSVINSYGDNNGMIETLVDAGFRVIAHDYRGHGMSDKPHDVSAYGAALIGDLKRLVDFLQLETFHIAGYSAGSETAIAFTVKYPAHVLSLTTGGSGWTTEALVKEIKGVGSCFGSCCCMTLNSCCDVLQCLAPSSMAYHKGQNKILHPLVKWDLKAFVAFSNAGGGSINAASLTEAEMRAITVPMLSVFGEKDPEVQNSVRMEGVVPNLIRIVIPGLNHDQALGIDPERRLRKYWHNHIVAARDAVSSTSKGATLASQEMER